MAFGGIVRNACLPTTRADVAAQRVGDFAREIVDEHRRFIVGAASAEAEDRPSHQGGKGPCGSRHMMSLIAARKAHQVARSTTANAAPRLLCHLESAEVFKAREGLRIRDSLERLTVERSLELESAPLR